MPRRLLPAIDPRPIFVGLIALALIAVMALPEDPPSLAQPTPNRGAWSCSVDNIAASLTKCAPTPAAPAGLRTFITDIVAQSTTGTAGQFLLRTGTGTNCATGTTSIFPSSAGGTVRWAAPANTVAPFVADLNTPLIVPADTDVCLLGVATNTVTAHLSGYYNP